MCFKIFSNFYIKKHPINRLRPRNKLSPYYLFQDLFEFRYKETLKCLRPRNKMSRDLGPRVILILRLENSEQELKYLVQSNNKYVDIIE